MTVIKRGRTYGTTNVKIFPAIDFRSISTKSWIQSATIQPRVLQRSVFILITSVCLGV